MTSDTELDRIRGQALDRVERARRRFKWMIGLTFLSEGVFLATYTIVMDFEDRLHWLILIAAALVYITVVTALFAVGAFIHLSEQRIHRAIALLDR